MIKIMIITIIETIEIKHTSSFEVSTSDQASLKFFRLLFHLHNTSKLLY